MSLLSGRMAYLVVSGGIVIGIYRQYFYGAAVDNIVDVAFWGSNYCFLIWVNSESILNKHFVCREVLKTASSISYLSALEALEAL